MFNPPGYIAWSDVWHAASSYANNVFAAHLHSDGDFEKLGNAIISEEGMTQFAQLYPEAAAKLGIVGVAFRAQGVFQAWIMSKIITTFPPSVCSATGNLVQSSYPLLSHRDQLDWYDWSWPVNENDELSVTLFLYAAQGESRNPITGFNFINVESGTINCHGQDAIDRMMSEGIESQQAKAFEAAVSPMNGWALCWSPEQIPTDFEDILKAMKWTWPRLARAGGASEEPPKGLSNVYECLLTAYPGGKQNHTWKEVERQTGYSRRTIERALAVFDMGRAWAKGAQSAN